MTAIAPLTGTTALPQVQSSWSEYRSELRTRQVALATIISGIGVAVLFSATGVLPAAILSAAKVSLIGTTIIYTAAVIAVSQNKKMCDLVQKDSGNYNRSTARAPWKSCLFKPIIEEVLYRGFLQGALQWGFKGLLSSAVITVFGAQIPLYACAAIVVSSAFFGAMHATNGHTLSQVQAVVTGMQSLFLFSPLYYYHGLWASCLAHIINNTFVHTIQAIKEGILLRAEERKQTIPNASFG